MHLFVSTIIKYIRAICLLIVFALSACSAPSDMRLSGLFTEGMVLQQKSKSALRGYASPGTRITIKTDWNFSVTTSAGEDSIWVAYVNVPEADMRQHTIELSTADTVITVGNILIGEVWLAAGQSNMEMPMKGWGTDTIINASADIASSSDDLLRFFAVYPNLGYVPQKRLGGVWHSAAPEYTARFGALPYYFGRHLLDSLRIPIGIVQAVYGGSPLMSWVNSDLAKENDKYPDVQALLAKTNEEYQVYKKWLDALPSVSIDKRGSHDPLDELDIYDDYVNLSMSDVALWDKMQLPGYWENHGLKGFDGVVWFVRKVALPDSWIGRDINLRLGCVDDRDRAYVNGTLVGQTTGIDKFGLSREYRIPSNIVMESELTIAVRVLDERSKGGIIGMTDGTNMRLELDTGETLDLEGEWAYRPVALIDGSRLVLLGVENNAYATRPHMSMPLCPDSPSMVYNGIIAPLSGYSFAGVILHIGEADVWDSHSRSQVSDLLPQVVASFRKVIDHRTPTPIIIGQPSPGAYADCLDTDAGFVRSAIFEGQSHSENTYIVSTLDIGSNHTLRPPYKEIEAKRMVDVALSKVYNRKPDYPSSPIPTSATQSHQIVKVDFDNADGLYLDTDRPTQFEIAGADTIFFPAKALVSSHSVTIFSHMVSDPVFVRYAYTNCAQNTLWNKYHLPCITFFLEVEKEEPIK